MYRSAPTLRPGYVSKRWSFLQSKAPVNQWGAFVIRGLSGANGEHIPHPKAPSWTLSGSAKLLNANESRGNKPPPEIRRAFSPRKRTWTELSPRPEGHTDDANPTAANRRKIELSKSWSICPKIRVCQFREFGWAFAVSGFSIVCCFFWKGAEI